MGIRDLRSLPPCYARWEGLPFKSAFGGFEWSLVPKPIVPEESETSDESNESNNYI